MRIIAWYLETSDGTYSRVIPDNEIDTWRKNWSTYLKTGRATLTALRKSVAKPDTLQPDCERREVIAQIIDPVAFSARERSHIPVQPEKQTRMDIALSKADAIIASNIVSDRYVTALLNDLQQAEAKYRHMYNFFGGWDMSTGRAWDRLRRLGDRARKLLNDRHQ